MARNWWAFQECGWPSWLSLLLSALAFAFSIAAFGLALLRAHAPVGMAWLAVGFALSPLGMGAMGEQIGRSRVDRVISGPFADASQRERIRAEGYREARSCVAVGSTLSVPSLLLASVALASAYALRRKRVLGESNGRR